ncbi:MAG: SH3 domain-containing protein [Polaromonas sp.]|nr:SH3 domain-containing protein [Polaromonas sp.]
MTRLNSLPRLLSLLLLPLLAVQAAQAREMVSVNRPLVHMREGAGTQHDALWAFSRGYPLQVMGRKGAWLKVRDFENDSGWVYRPLLGKTPHHVVKSSVANIRSAPTTGSRIIGKAQLGEVLRTLERRERWVKVQQEGGLKGWVARRLLWGW